MSNTEQIKAVARQAKASLRKMGIKPVWYFKTPAVQYGLAIVNGEVWSFSICAAQRRLLGRPGIPLHFSPTPQLAKGFAKAMQKIGI